MFRIQTGWAAWAGITAASFLTLNTVASAQMIESQMSDRPKFSLLSEILVVASRREAQLNSGAAYYVTPEDLAKFEYSDVNRILRQVPGINIQEEDGYGLRPNIGLRATGLDRSAKIVIMEDGVLAAPAPYAAPSAYYFPRSARMEGVEVVKGSAAIKYGPQTIGGAINMVSVSIPENSSGKLNILFGSDGERHLHGIWGTTYEALESLNVGVVLESLQDRSEGFKNLDGGGNTGFDLEDYVAKIRLSTKEGVNFAQSLEFKIQYSDEESDETYLGLTQEDFNAKPNRRYRGSQADVMNAEHKSFQLTHAIDFNAVTLTNMAYYNAFGRNWYKLDKVDGVSISSILGDPATHAGPLGILKGESGLISADDALRVKANNRDYTSYGLQTMVSGDIDVGHTSHHFEIGMRYHEDEMDRYQWVDGYRMENGAMIRTSIGEPGTDSNRIDSAKAWALFIQDEMTFDGLGGEWTFVPGLRYESIDLKRKDYGKADVNRTGSNLKTVENTVDVLIPGMGATYQFADQWLLLAGINKGFTNPAPGNTAAEEESTNYEVGARYLGDNLTVEAIGFFNDYDNLVGSCTNSTGGGCTIGDQFDGGKVEAYGLELSGQYDLGNALGWSISAPINIAYTYTKAKFQNAFDSDFGPWSDVQKGDELPYIPKHQLNTRVGLEGDKWALNLNANYVGNTRTTAGQGKIPLEDKVGARLVFDVSASYDVTENASLFISADNLTDVSYIAARRPAGLRPGKDRSYLAGLKLKF